MCKQPLVLGTNTKKRVVCVGVVTEYLTYVARLSLPLRRAHTLKAILQVDAGSTLNTWAGSTVVQF